MEPLVHIILVNYNGIVDTAECIKSLQEIDYSNYKIIVVENHSKDEDAMRAHSYINENATVLYSQENNGFSDGNNIGIKYAMEEGADYVLLLNNDTTVHPDFLKELVTIAENDAQTGIVTGNIYYYSQPDVLWYSNGNYNRKTGMTDMCVPSTEEKRQVSFVCGCLMLIKAEVIHSIGYLSDDFFLYSEDTEYGCRAVDAGWNMMWTAKSKIYHKISASTGENSPFQNYYLLRNNLIMIQRYGSNKIYAYARRLFQVLKDIIKRRTNLKVSIWAVNDFRRKILGKVNRF